MKTMLDSTTSGGSHKPTLTTREAVQLTFSCFRANMEQSGYQLMSVEGQEGYYEICGQKFEKCGFVQRLSNGGFITHFDPDFKLPYFV
jgi:hypothetical protein